MILLYPLVCEAPRGSSTRWLIFSSGFYSTTIYCVADLLHYLDDFFTLGPAGALVCSNSLSAIQRASLDIGIPLAPDKCDGPTTCITFLGIELNSMDMTARLPQDKLSELQTIITSWVGKKFCTRKELESLVGKLSHACAVVDLGRTFLQRLINLLRGSNQRQKFIRLTKQARLDLQWWRDFLPTWNGISFFDLPEWAPVADIEHVVFSFGTRAAIQSGIACGPQFVTFYTIQSGNAYGLQFARRFVRYHAVSIGAHSLLRYQVGPTCGSQVAIRSIGYHTVWYRSLVAIRKMFQYVPYSLVPLVANRWLGTLICNTFRCLPYSLVLLAAHSLLHFRPYRLVRWWVASL